MNKEMPKGILFNVLFIGSTVKPGNKDYFKF